MPAAGPSLEALRATVERMEARASAPNDPSLAESRRLYAELAERFQTGLRAPRDVALAKSAALMVLQALAQARSRASVLVNIDVSDLPRATKFYCEALALEVGRRLGEGAVEVVGVGAPIYLRAKATARAPRRRRARSAITSAIGRRCTSISSCSRYTLP